MLKLYNFLSHKIESFQPLNPSKIGLYTCGPTVYDFAHIGNLRTYIFEDILKRVLEANGYKVTHVMNITDVDDKIIKGAINKGLVISKFVKPYEEAFFDDLEKLNIKKANFYPKATDHINEMIVLISRLIDTGLAYKAGDGVYFAIAKFKNYGKLSGLNLKNLKAGVRVAADEYDKEEPADFALWKFKRKKEPSWPAPFGEGRPGWHIECSVMAQKYLGQSVDIHTGAVDLLFPHHENEIAQSEGATGKKFVNFFLEGEHLLVSGQKMAKSLGNIITLREIEDKGLDPLSFRYLILTAHYRTQLNFTWDSLAATQNALENLRYEMTNLPKRQKEDEKVMSDFMAALSNDLDTPKALAILWDLVRDEEIGDEVKEKTLVKMDEILGLGLKNLPKTKLPESAKKLIEEREQLRKKGKWQEADKIRQDLAKMGVELMDTQEGPKWKVKSDRGSEK